MKHLRYLRVFNFILACLWGIVELVLLTIAILVYVLDSFKGYELRPMALWVMAVVLVLFTPFTVLHILTGLRVVKGRWRPVQTVLAAVQFFIPPIGTAFGIYAFWVCWGHTENKAFFKSGGVPASQQKS
ncbi:MAG: hypothetical protein JXR96_11060 [Deltaproteobacteria bacterium]|nr:hypothetical protein [Deltaproteobacteria bacterium]